MNDQTAKNKKRTGLIIVLVLIIVACLVTTAVLLLRPKEEEKPANEPAKGVVGRISDNWDTEVSNPSQDGESSGSKRGTQIPGYSSASMNEGDMSLKLRIGNPPDNHVGFIAVLKLKDGTILYESPLLNPGQGLEEVPLTQTLKKGTYEAVVEYRCILLEDGKTPLNSAESGFTLYVY